MGYLIGADTADEFMKWAKGVDFWGRWMPEEPDMYGLLLGEHGWSPAFKYFTRTYDAGRREAQFREMSRPHSTNRFPVPRGDW